MKIKLGIGVCCFFFSVNTAISQINYGTTGLMNLPTADMQAALRHQAEEAERL